MNRLNVAQLVVVPVVLFGSLGGCPDSERGAEPPVGDVASDGDVTSDGDAAPLPATVVACGEATVLEAADDPGARGPWEVGARTVTIGRLTAEVWYPAEPGSAAGAQTIRYDIREGLPADEAAKVPDADNPWQECDCYRDLPIDAERGPYPVVVFIHGTASFRTQSLAQTQHWASRGFVVVAADHPGLKLGDYLALVCPNEAEGELDLGGDLDAMLAALAAPAGDLAFLDGRLDMTRVGLAGHSAGGNAVAELADRAGVRIIVPMASRVVAAASDELEMSLFLGGNADSVVAYDKTIEAYDGSAGPKRLVGLENAGHLAFSDICAVKNGAGQNLLEIAEESGVCGADLAGLLFDCGPDLLAPETSQTIVQHVTTAALEEVLQCRDRGAVWSGLQAAFPDVAEVREAGR